MHSCIYVGQVRHRRLKPVRHAFAYRVFLMYLDLEELPEVFAGRWFWSDRRTAIARFERANYLGPADRPLADCVRECVADHTGHRPTGPIRLLTNLSYFSYCFNPVSYYYCFDETGDRIEAIVVEVTNTPWGERQTYVLHDPDDRTHRRLLRFGGAKSLHVSPFMPMDINYEWCFTHPGQDVAIQMANRRKGERVFDASVVLERSEINSASLALTLLRFPAMTLQVIAAIHWQALKLWLKGTPVYEHPRKRRKIAAASQ